ncbi:hypothetical protein RHMOL_Rhmol05G0149100 [Rhododendron molle]|uniref:Uncharacterized protein n=1 Tax=Rhododendron molle TaxID=49168 RepID=A0ACC0NQN9_RHOML|nr:hypothetical protein RHMOL_Rhmol05G0149100 [Rhododendron molle]
MMMMIYRFRNPTPATPKSPKFVTMASVFSQVEEGEITDRGRSREENGGEFHSSSEAESLALVAHRRGSFPCEGNSVEGERTVLEEIRPYLVGAAGGSLEFVAIEEPIVKVRITGPAAGVMTVRVAVTQKLREKIPAIAAVQLL